MVSVLIRTRADIFIETFLAIGNVISWTGDSKGRTDNWGQSESARPKPNGRAVGADFARSRMQNPHAPDKAELNRMPWTRGWGGWYDPCVAYVQATEPRNTELHRDGFHNSSYVHVS